MARGMGEPDKMIKRQLGRKRTVRPRTVRPRTVRPRTVRPRTVRPRIECLMELGSFQEIGASAGIPMRP
jgi:hypothetical protein